MNISSVYETPLYIGLPHYYECQNEKTVQNVFIDDKPLGQVKNINVEFKVEPYSGITTHISYGYEVFYKKLIILGGNLY